MNICFAITDKYEYEFNGWNGLLAVSGDMTVTADYIATIRNYKVTFYNMTTGALEGENDMPYGSWIERTMSAGGYVFDSCPFLAEVELRGAFDVPTSWDANWLGWNDDVSLVFTGESGE